MITLSGQRFVGVSQADETRAERSKRANHAIKQGESMITLSGQRFVGVSQADETRGERSKRVNHAIKQRDSAFSTCTVRLEMLWCPIAEGQSRTAKTPGFRLVRTHRPTPINPGQMGEPAIRH
jgi:hypothetical protein